MLDRNVMKNILMWVINYDPRKDPEVWYCPKCGGWNWKTSLSCRHVTADIVEFNQFMVKLGLMETRRETIVSMDFS
jgi:hypothetical protein